MKLTAAFMLLCCLQASAKSYAQNVTLDLKNAPLQKVFTEISRQTGISIVYSEEQLNGLRPVTVQVSNIPVEEVLKICMRDQPIQYRMEDGLFVIQKKLTPPEDAKPVAPLPPPVELRGRVVDETGEPVAAATVILKGTNRATSTDNNGHFTLNVPSGSVTLVISHIGFADQQKAVQGGETSLEITLIKKSGEMGQVVVTALGIRKSERSLTYSTQIVQGDELTRVKTDNLMNTLNGKVAGMTISPSASGVGGSVKVLLRGSKSAASGNGPLYVIDGVPITNTSNYNGQPNNTYGGSTSTDGGDGISNLNPDDIESVNVLKGASAAALYGSQAANGVILIVTKKGKAGHALVNFSSTASMSNITYKPKFQNEYGQGNNGVGDSSSTYSWGPKISGASDNLSSFYRTGSNFVNSINLSGGSDLAQSYFSYANTAGTGVEPTNKLSRNNINFRETVRLLDNKLTLDGNVSYMTQKISNAPGLGLFFNSLTGLYLFPRGRDISPYKSQYAVPDASRNGLLVQNWPFNNADNYQQNPWWISNKNPNTATRNRTLINVSAKYDVNSWLSIQARGDLDRFDDVYEQDLYAGTTTYLSSANGSLNLNDRTAQQAYGDLIATFKVPTKSDFGIDGLIGTSITDALTPQGYSLTQSGGLGLFIPNVFTIQNTQASLPTSATVSSNVASLKGHSQTQSIFANLNLSYKNWAYLTLTGRNDWSSNLAFTPNVSYFYPSAGLSFILSQLFTLPSDVSYAKIRGSLAQVGNSVPQYASNPLNYIGANGTINFNSLQPFSQLKPEKTNSLELGTEWRFFKDRLNFQFTYYKTNTLNQFFPIVPAASTGYTRAYVNAGNIQNSGVEIMLGYDIVRSRDFTWNSSANFAQNKSLVKDVYSQGGINQFILTNPESNAYQSVLNKGGGYGDIYGYALQRDAKGRILIGSGGLPTKSNVFSLVGNPNPKFQAGWSNSFTYKKFVLSFLIDGKFGGQVMSFTQAMMDQYGVSQASGQARDQGGVKINGADASGNAVTTIDAATWYSVVAGRNGVSGEYVYSASVVRLREAALGYSFAVNHGFFKLIRLSLTGRNLLYFYKKAPYDPELTMSTGNGLSGVDVFNQPATRNLGLSLNVNF